MQIRIVTIREDKDFKLHLAKLFKDFITHDKSFLVQGEYSDWSEPIHDMEFLPLENGNLDFYLEAYKFYALIENGLPVGMVGLWGVGPSLVWFFIEESYRNQGLGRRLYNHVLEEEKLAKFNLIVRPNNKEAIDFYQSLGLVCSGQILTNR